MALPTYITFANLLADLRVMIQDVEARVIAFRFRTTDPEVTALTLTITATTLTTTPVGGTVAALNITLTGKTIRSLVDAILAVDGYTADVTPQASWEHAATDLRLTPAGGLDIGQGDFDVQHHAFSDAELTRILSRAIITHNPGFGDNTVPAREAEPVLLLAHISICKLLVHENAKFYAIEGQVSTGNKGERVAHYLSLADHLRDEYDRIVDRLGLRPDTDLDGDSESGVIHVGTLRRVSHRYSGARVPFGANTKPETPNGFAGNVTDDSLEDSSTETYLYWDRLRQRNISHVVIARQTAGTNMLLANYRAMLSRFSEDDDFAVAATIYDARKTWFKDTELTAATAYSYRLYVIDRNGEWACSDVVTVTTDA